MSNDEILDKLRLNQLRKDSMKQIKYHYEKTIKQPQAKVIELEVPNSKLTDDVNDLREGLKEVKRYSVESEQVEKTSAYLVWNKRIPKAGGEPITRFTETKHSKKLSSGDITVAHRLGSTNSQWCIIHWRPVYIIL